MMKLKNGINGVLVLSILLFTNSCSKIEPKIHKLEGNVFGTSFHITYMDYNNSLYTVQIDSLFKALNRSLSTYDLNSDISKFNNSDDTIEVDDSFQEVFLKAQKIYTETDGVFDPTIGILVNAWGFGPGKKFRLLTSEKIKELLAFVGYHNVSMKDGRVSKSAKSVYLDYNAIAKGYGVDVISRFLENNGVSNYMVEIGGEVRVRGKNEQDKFWRIGIEKPNFNGTRSLEEVVELKNESMATSGNYRKYRIDSITGERYVHTIDTKTGYSAKRDLLSASVISSSDCADVDGYATAFMAMGFIATKEFLRTHKELKVFLIYINDSDETKTYSNF